jgi:hypothetical protein
MHVGGLEPFGLERCSGQLSDPRPAMQGRRWGKVGSGLTVLTDVEGQVWLHDRQILDVLRGLRVLSVRSSIPEVVARWNTAVGGVDDGKCGQGSGGELNSSGCQGASSGPPGSPRTVHPGDLAGPRCDRPNRGPQTGQL